MNELILVDAHVHLHQCFDIATFLEGAYTNFHRAAQDVDRAKGFVGVLLFTEGPHENGLVRLIDQLERRDDGADRGLWKMHKTEEETSLCLTDGGQRTLFVVAGRQVVTRERLEVLALATRRSFEHNASIEELIHEIGREGALIVIPWGWGKWTGARGKLLRRLIQTPGLPPFYLGDSANRPAFWPCSPIFRLAQERGIRNLSGSDPLPFRRENRRAGRCGFILGGSLDRRYPVADLKRLLMNPSVRIQPYGRQETPLRFMRNQLAMQLRKGTSRR